MTKRHTKTELEKKLEAQILKAKEAGGEPDGSTEEAPVKLEPAPAVEGESVVTVDGETYAAADIQAVIEERDAANNQVLRTLAEFDNYRKRVARDAEQVRKTAAEALMRDLLPVLDNLARALDHAEDKSEPFVQGMDLVLKQFQDVLGRHGLEAIPAEGERFDPNVHDAMLHINSEEVPEDHVVQEYEKGYRLGGFILRPSRVMVSKGAAGGEEVSPERDAPADDEPEAETD